MYVPLQSAKFRKITLLSSRCLQSAFSGNTPQPNQPSLQTACTTSTNSQPRFAPNARTLWTRTEEKSKEQNHRAIFTSCHLVPLKRANFSRQKNSPSYFAFALTSTLTTRAQTIIDDIEERFIPWRLAWIKIYITKQTTSRLISSQSRGSKKCIHKSWCKNAFVSFPKLAKINLLKLEWEIHLTATRKFDTIMPASFHFGHFWAEMPSHSLVCFQRVNLPLRDLKQLNFLRHLRAIAKIFLHLASRRSLKRGATGYGFSQANVVNQLSKLFRDLF